LDAAARDCQQKALVAEIDDGEAAGGAQRHRVDHLHHSLAGAERHPGLDLFSRATERRSMPSDHGDQEDQLQDVRGHHWRRSIPARRASVATDIHDPTPKRPFYRHHLTLRDERTVDHDVEKLGA
jgi:hypothetical protein